MYNAEDIKVNLPTPGFYPTNLGDFSLPFSLSSIWKKKMEILPPETIHQLEMLRKMEEIKEMNAIASERVQRREKPKPKSKQRRNAGSGESPKAVSTPKTASVKSAPGTPATSTQVRSFLAFYSKFAFKQSFTFLNR